MTNNSEFSARFLKVIEYIGVTANDFAKKIGYNRSQTIYDIINGKVLPSFDFFHRLLLSEYSVINIEWLITGRGEMLKKTMDTVEDSLSPPYGKSCKLCSEKERIIEAIKDSSMAKDITIKSLLEQIEVLSNGAHSNQCEQKRKAG
jgi:DNA-binding XRE family transcriptional regulator